MEKMTDCNVGIDVSKSSLDAYRLEDEVAARFPMYRRLPAVIAFSRDRGNLAE